MKKSLALIVVVAGAAVVCHAESSPAGQPAPPDAKTATTSQPAPSFKPRQLSAEERAQLRRQLVEYSRLAGK